MCWRRSGRGAAGGRGVSVHERGIVDEDFAVVVGSLFFGGWSSVLIVKREGRDG